MKSIILLLLIGLSISYSTSEAIAYARGYCNIYNSAYENYYGSDNANFVSQCLIAGGQTLDGCIGIDNKGSIPNIADLKSCLTKKGWKSQIGYTHKFKAGYPFFTNNEDAMLATVVVGNEIRFCGHTKDRCDRVTSGDQYTYFYLDK